MTLPGNRSADRIQERRADEPPTADSLRAWLHLANMQFTPRLTTSLLACFRYEPQAIFAASDGELDDVPGMQARHLVRLRDKTLEVTERQWNWFEKHDVRLLRRDQPEYPPDLREIHDPPPMLFLRGSLTLADHLSVGIVGSRHATPYGRSVSERMARELAEQGITIVSGGAAGIDAAAHRGAIAGGGRTLAILGCGLDVDYPRENRGLFEQVIQQGALISEYPLGAQPESWRFPARNRIISGMSQGTLVVEAPLKSGALITARCAAEQGRPVLVIPGNIDRPTSAGSNELMRDGAIPVLSSEDIRLALNLVTLPARKEAQRAFDLLEEETDSLSKTAAALPRKSSPSAERYEPKTPPASSRALSSVQQKLVDCLTQTPKHIDVVSQQSGLTAAQAGVELTLLELEGLVRRLPGNTYISAR